MANNEKAMAAGKKFSRQEKSWILYDWANSVYATNIMAAIFPIYFTSVAGGADTVGMQWWGYGTSIATLIVAVLAPILGSLGDYRGMKKKFFTFFMVFGVVFTLIMAIFDNWQMLLVGYVLSFIGFSGSCLFYDSFLTDVTTPERADKVSSWGYAMGYIGGSTIPFVISIAILLSMNSSPLSVKIAVVITSVWWAVFSIPMLKNVRQTHHIGALPKHMVSNAFKRVGITFREIVKTKGLFLYILAYFFFIDGVGTVIHMATSYGTTLGLDSTGMILALLVTQIVAVPCSIFYGKLAGKFGSVRMIGIAIGIYFIICLVGFYMGFTVESAPAGDPAALAKAQGIFWGMSFLVGTVQGGIQALSRSHFSKMVPPSKSNEYFGFFDIFGKFATVMGPALIAVITSLTGRSSIGILSLLVLFAIGGALLFSGRKDFDGAIRAAREDV